MAPTKFFEAPHTAYSAVLTFGKLAGQGWKGAWDDSIYNYKRSTQNNQDK